MNSSNDKFKASLTEITIILLISGLGLVFIWFMYTNVKEQNLRNDLQLGKSIVAALPLENITQLGAVPDDTLKPAYQMLKTAFRKIAAENKEVRFVYLYAQKNGKFYFLVDSEPSDSPDYSPPGQEFTEVAEADKKPFTDGKSSVTPPLTDRWGTWVSILVPVRNRTGETIAVFGMDINARSWNRTILLEVVKSSLLVIALILLGLLTMRFFAKNRYLKKENNERINAEKALSESEARYRLLYENASIGIYQTTPDGKVLLSNMALLKILGYKSFDELKERDIDKGEFDPTYSRAEFKRIMESEGEIHGLESVWTRQDGKTVYIRENAKAVYDSQGNITFYDGTIEDITDRKLAEKALKYSEERFRQIAEQSREMVWEVDKNGLFTYVSPLSGSVLGFTPDELIGKKYFFDFHPEETREDYKKATLEAFTHKVSFQDYINEVIKSTGESIWVTTNGTPILDDNGELAGYRGSESDITERIQRENLLKKLTMAVEQSPVSIVITNVEGAIEYGNPKACETTGYSFQELAGQNPRLLKSGYKPSSDYKELWATINSGKIWHGEFLNKRKNGELYWEAASISPIFDNEGNIINFLAVKEDITNIKKLISELKEAKDRAESSDLLKTAFIKNISHEIRTPLNGIVGMSEQILKTSNSQQDKEQLLNLIKDSSSRLISTVNNYLDISMIVSGNMIVQIQPFDLNKLLIELKNEIQQECISKNLTLILSFPAGTDRFMINSDADLILKTLMHLLNNAVKFTDSGSVTFGFEIKTDVIVLFVKDTGMGIDPDFIPHISEAFTQADVSDTRAFEGSGLGMAIAYRLVHLLSGKIRVESEKDLGTSFYITFPL
jgi:PAS domain S-box-containing protein